MKNSSNQKVDLNDSFYSMGDINTQVEEPTEEVEEEPFKEPEKIELKEIGEPKKGNKNTILIIVLVVIGIIIVAYIGHMVYYLKS